MYPRHGFKILVLNFNEEIFMAKEIFKAKPLGTAVELYRISDTRYSRASLWLKLQSVSVIDSTIQSTTSWANSTFFDFIK